MKRDDPKGIDERSFRFFCDVMGFVESIPRGPRTDRLIEQLVDAAGSITGNRDEALGGSSRREFVRYNEIALRGANESVKWLRACAARRLGDQASVHETAGRRPATGEDPRQDRRHDETERAGAART